ncbi:MAG: hypothetical protein H2172_13680 [Opitutus sp.]|nr:hypothetical protein [Opitutus sp.]MCS6277668.1 hypothetical protein [Opitutus sp.]MCS6300786.1 hypothetical protein [Opitutus sp.]
MDYVIQLLAVISMFGLIVYLMILGDWRITTPFGIVGFVVFINYAYKYAWNWFFSVDPLFGLNWGDLSIPIIVLVFSIGFAAFFASCTYGRSVMRPYCVKLNSVPREVYAPVSVALALVYLYLVAPPALILICRWVLGIWPWEGPAQFRGFIQSGGNMYLYIIAIFSIQAGFLIGGQYVFILKRFPPLWVLLGFPCAIIYALNTGFSSTIITAWMPLGYFLMMKKRWRLEVLIPILVPLASYYAMVHLIYKRSNADGATLSMVDSARQLSDIGFGDYDFLNRLDYLEQYVRGFDLATSLPSWDYGLNMLSVFIQWIPRYFWPDKMLNFSSLMTREIEPVNFYQGITANFGGLNEFIMAFGLFGVALFIFLLYGVFCFGLKYVAKAGFSDRSLIFYIFCYIPYLSSGLVAGFINDLSLPSLIISLILVRFCFPCTEAKR